MEVEGGERPGVTIDMDGVWDTGESIASTEVKSGTPQRLR